ncbi:hypothetical protein SAMN05660461_4882 [Chitinophaga ginsengisegetis]|uniref:Uncharacterized protein n=1 Tax=Chitinophaga ginsengisegetis TaxID=393003 RepID=A0A1T5P8A7_9BACT|nr:hypothetical protein [Chitinophaga ginsengisegetis]MDR6647386.1 hypothetical protein [Chitinophaga ginsengisegetis]MDR6653736.1 hypothetical protein [Chitinophaga ginsengisegetis]SKD09004.1 hypothetical protein SAMN05660461_4882 [Chitinophaga ginsengisegetis]
MHSFRQPCYKISRIQMVKTFIGITANVPWMGYLHNTGIQ